MNRRACLLTTIFVFIVVGFAVAQTKGPRARPYKLLKAITVGGEGGWDYLATDEASRRVYVTHQTKVLVYGLNEK
jgi:hypothetical protein